METLLHTGDNLTQRHALAVRCHEPAGERVGRGDVERRLGQPDEVLQRPPAKERVCL